MNIEHHFQYFSSSLRFYGSRLFLASPLYTCADKDDWLTSRGCRLYFHRKTGFTLIEILVAIVVISVGLLGIATMQIKGLKNNNSAFYRTQASILAYEVLDSMRANRRLANVGSYNINLADSTPTGTEIAQDDIRNWRNSCGNLLPNCQTAVSYSSASGVVRVTIQWDDSRGSGGGTTQSFILDSQLCDPGGSSCQ